jgi:hypothetical protein
LLTNLAYGWRGSRNEGDQHTCERKQTHIISPSLERRIRKSSRQPPSKMCGAHDKRAVNADFGIIGRAKCIIADSPITKQSSTYLRKLQPV